MNPIEMKPNLVIHCTSSVKGEPIEFGVMANIDPKHLGSSIFKEAYLAPLLAQLAMEIEARLCGTDSEWTISSVPMAAEKSDA